jgi:GTP cyclohydrolase I
MDKTSSMLLTEWLAQMSIPVPAETPQRIVTMYEQMLYPPPWDAPPFTFTTFPNEEGLEDMVVVSCIDFYSMCEHHLIPFFGQAHVGYLPHERICGLSKIPRTVDWFARRPQLQERMTMQIADYICAELRPKGVIVLVEATHLCVAMRGIQKINAVTKTSALRGVFMAQPAAREEFFAIIGRGG